MMPFRYNKVTKLWKTHIKTSQMINKITESNIGLLNVKENQIIYSNIPLINLNKYLSYLILNKIKL